MRDVSEATGVGRAPVVHGDRSGRLTSIDLRGEVPVVEYRRRIVDTRWSVLAILVILNVLDVISTVAVLAAGGTERNPLMRPLIEGVWPAVLVKTAVLVLVAWLLNRCVDSRRIEVMMACTTGWYIAVVSWNVTVLALG